MTRVVLKEWETSDPLPITKDKVPILRQRLGSLADVVYDLEGVKLRARSYVGYIPIDEDLQLIVLPKIENLSDFFYVLEKAGLTPKVWMDYPIFAEIDDSEREDAPLFLVKVLLRRLRLLKRDGFYRKSIRRSETRSAVKGKIEITHTVRRCLMRGKSHNIHCSYFDPTVDTIENRFIKYTLWRLIKSGLPRDVKRELRKFWRIFIEIPFQPSELYLTEIEKIIRRRRLPSSRSYYIDILSLCFLIIANSTVIVKAGDDIRLNAFAINMDRMFENYVRNALAEVLHPELIVVDGNQDRRPLFLGMDKPAITPDIIVDIPSESLVVADVKYKEKDLPNERDWYQVIAYTLALGVPVGVLIYSSDEVKSPQMFRIGDKTLWVCYFQTHKLREEEISLGEFLQECAIEVLRDKKAKGLGSS
jgi:5-methylcytosine-specific restriction enzyme subunit McrC